MTLRLAAQVEGNSAEAARQLDDAHRSLLQDNSIQFELPIADRYTATVPRNLPQQQPHYRPPANPSNIPQPGQNVPADPSASPPPAPDLPSGGSGIEGLMQVFLWVAAGIALAILLYWIFAFFRDRGLGERKERTGKKRRETEPETWRPAPEQAAQLLDEADVLAGQGRYDEAARLLLHRSIREIDGHRPDLVRPALTSRDIAGHPLLPLRPAAAFARIAALVERSFFARRPLGPEDWQDCRAAYHDFAFAEGWQG
jgi:hypothetical protein